MKFAQANNLIPIIALTLLIGFSGCGKKASDQEPAGKSAKNEASPNDDHGHSHDDSSDGGHTHGIGPHGGTVADWGGGKYHIEFVVDRAKNQASVYVLGDSQKDPSPVKCDSITLAISNPMFEVELKAVPQDSDPENSCSRFVGTDEQLSNAQGFEGTISGLVAGTPFSGDFKEKEESEHNDGEIGGVAAEFFKQMDSNGDKAVTLEEMKAGMGSQTEVGDTSDPDAARFFKQMDSNGDKTVTLEELTADLEGQDGEHGHSHEEGGHSHGGEDGEPVGIADFFKQMDTDRNGKIERSEVPEESQGNFDQADKNGDKIVTLEELKASFGGEEPNPGEGGEGEHSHEEGGHSHEEGGHSHGDQDGEPDVAEFFKQRDTDGNGKIERSEVPEENHGDFDDADTNGDKIVTLEELKASFGGEEPNPGEDGEGEHSHEEGGHSHGDQDGEPDVAEFFKQLDADGNGKIERSEVPEENHGDFDDADTNGDKMVTPEELKASFGAGDNVDRKVIPGTMTKFYYAIGNPESDTVIVNTQGGPMPMLLTDEFSEVFSGVDLDEAMVVNVHQSQTIDSEKFSERKLTFEEAKAYDTESVKILADVVDEFLRDNKRVYVVGFSYGAWMVQDLLATQGSVADGYLIVAGRLDMPEAIWMSFSQSGGGYFKDGIEPIIEEATEIDESKLGTEDIIEFNLPKIAAGLGHKRYTQLLQDVDLSKVIYVYGQRDIPVGRLSDAEVNFLESKSVQVVATEGGHMDEKMMQHMTKILAGYISEETESVEDK